MSRFFLNKVMVELVILFDFILNGVSFFVQGAHMHVTLIFLLIILLWLVLIYKIKGRLMVIPILWLDLAFFLLSNVDTLLIQRHVIVENGVWDHAIGFSLVIPLVGALIACYKLFMRGL